MEWTMERIRQTAKRQSAADLNCDPADFDRSENVVVVSRARPDARRYLSLPFLCNIVTYGGNVVASAGEAYTELVKDYVNRFPTEHLFETPNLHVLNDAFAPYDARVCFMAEYFLPELSELRERKCPYELRLLGPSDFAPLYLPEWSNALCEKRKELDVLGVGAFEGGKLIGLAACSADCDTMWQIGVDVLPEARRKGVASAMTSRLALEILERGKVPFYCAAWSNIPSVRNAMRAGFRPAWVEMTVKSRAFVDEMNGCGTPEAE